jgi:riboflavin synthase
MFTGLIETTGTIEKLTHKAQSLELLIAADKKDFLTQVGASIAVSGVCLTAEIAQANRFSAIAVAETLQRSTLGKIRVGERVNLERSLCAQGRFEGHIVLGHVDNVAKITTDKQMGPGLERTFEIPAGLRKFIAEKGSIAIDGISLTIAGIAGLSVTVALIPLTIANTTMQHKRPGDLVNIEIDVLARYIDSLLKKETDTLTSENSLSATLENFLA